MVLFLGWRYCDGRVSKDVKNEMPSGTIWYVLEINRDSGGFLALSNVSSSNSDYRNEPKSCIYRKIR